MSHSRRKVHAKLDRARRLSKVQNLVDAMFKSGYVVVKDISVPDGETLVLPCSTAGVVSATVRRCLRLGRGATLVLA